MGETIDPLEKGEARSEEREREKREDEKHLKCLKSISACLRALK